ncbi:hypothetical protein GCM10010840_16390 [Deinococcus aerolatus]|uniref:Homeodomain-like domain-containing protein n=1 Tax=Deinococcus aerolatus TaxID=522487 RepID=A0ABQ2G8K4_9DEIO|nr:hypothetical protein [Deinococcus aerolatus]GGL79252.1 hypothetical protein GCM10010840_16390 [Deinococcus aerolatus]
MGRGQELMLRLSQSELERISAAAQQIGLETDAFMRHAALTLAGNIKPRQHGQYQLSSIYREAASRGHVWAEGKSVRQLAILSGSYVTSVQNHLQAAYDIRAFRTLTERQIDSIRERYAAGDIRQEIAADLGVSNVTIGRYLKGQPTRWEREAREVRDRLRKSVPQEAPTEASSVPPNVQGLRNWAERLFAERAATLTWPTSSQFIAETLFDGNRAVARDWTGRMVRKGRLERLAPGWFTLGSMQDSTGKQ